jgi:hypothetical protein
MATAKQKQAARLNLERAREVQASRANGKEASRTGEGMSTAEKNHLGGREFAFPEDRKEPLSVAAHVRNAISRFNQVDGVSDAERERAWRRILTAAKKFNVTVSEGDWRELKGEG